MTDTFKATCNIAIDDIIADIDPRLYGSFVEHLGRAVYTGIYEPGHPSADKNGFRKDVLDLVRELNVPITRYPGGNFVSAYNWEDGIGPKDQRPTRLDLAWHTAEPNQVGIHEFADWCDLAKTEMMLAVNLGSRGLDHARNFLEYVNHPGGTEWSERRRKNGRADPWNVKLWCLGNEMDGPWQIGQKTAEEYGRVASETGKAMKAFDPSLELVVCGSSNPYMATYPQWEATVLDHTYGIADYISLHIYFNNHAKNTQRFLSESIRLDDYIGTIASTIDFVKAKHRSKKRVKISFDEWNVWYRSHDVDRPILRGEKGWPVAPPLVEDTYNFEDVLLVALILNTFIRRSDVVRIACLAQLVNVIAPIMTEPGGPAWRQTIFYPFAFASRLGRGKAMRCRVSSPTYDTDIADKVPHVDVAAVHDEASHRLNLFIINRHATETADLTLRLDGFTGLKVAEHHEMAGFDLQAVNTAAQQNMVTPQKAKGATASGNSITVSAKPHSYVVLSLTTTPS
jgi:alpha-L-arabinofuranosidase